MTKIPQGHRSRPYLIVAKNEDSFVGYPCTTHPNKNLKYYESYCFRKKAYKKEIGEYADSYLLLNQSYTLSIHNLKFYVASLKDYEMKRIQKLIKINQNHSQKSFVDFYIPCSIHEGDMILWKDKKYFVYSNQGKSLYCHPVHKKQESKNNVHITKKGSFSYVDIEKSECILLHEDIKIMHMCSDVEVEKITKAKRKRKMDKQGNLKKQVSYYFRYTPGTILENRFSQREYVYLFSIDSRSYGLNLEKAESGQLQIEKMQLEYLEYVDELVEDCKVDIIDDLMNIKGVFQDVLKDIYQKNFVGVLV